MIGQPHPAPFQRQVALLENLRAPSWQVVLHQQPRALDATTDPSRAHALEPSAGDQSIGQIAVSDTLHRTQDRAS